MNSSQRYGALEKEARKQGKTVFEIFAEKAMAEDTEPRLFVRLWKSLCEVMATKESHQTIENKPIGPVIGLPPIRQPNVDEVYPKITPKEFVS
jgi:hypothetical protein